MPDYISTEEAAQAPSYHVKYVRKMAREGKLAADKKVGVWWVGAVLCSYAFNPVLVFTSF